MGLIDRIRAGPIDLVKRVIYKKLIGPYRYRSPSGYDAARFWRDRLEKYGPSLRGVGDEGLSEEENRARHSETSRILMKALAGSDVRLPSARVLEVGCGSGFYTKKLQEAGVQSLMGIDITDALFPMLRTQFRDYEFRVADITADPIVGEFDLILMIDVLEHIVTDVGLRNAVGHLRGALAPGGLLLLGPVMPRARRHLFYVRFWSTTEIRPLFSDLQELEPIACHGGYLMGFRDRGPTGRRATH
ncbi:MAG: class I SAM-dependent methyltransferase [Actinomycetota bacterium]